jgi:tetratricopeptide (TPR) repeat protein
MAHKNLTNKFAYKNTNTLRLTLALSLAIGLLLCKDLRGLSAVDAQSITQTRPVTAQDQNRNAAQSKLDEGIELFRQGTPEALRMAITKYEEALRLWQAVNDLAMQATTLKLIGVAHDSMGEHQDSLNYLNRALQLLQNTDDRRGEADLRINIGRTYVKLGSLPNALDSFSRAQLLFKNIGDHEGEAAVFSGMGTIYYKLNDLDKAIDSYKNARQLLKSLKKQREEAVIVSNIAKIYRNMGKSQQALGYYREALPIFQSVGDRNSEAEMRFYIGEAYYSDRDWKEAVDNFSEASRLWTESGDRLRVAITLSYIGQIHLLSNKPTEAIKAYKRALDLWRELENQHEEAVTLNNIGLVYTKILRDIGKPPTVPNPRPAISQFPIVPSQQRDAVDAFDKAMKIWRALGNECKEAGTFYYISQVYRIAGDSKLASSNLNQANRLKKENNCSTDPCSGRAIQEQITCYERELARFRKDGKPAGETECLIRIGWLYHQDGEEQKAIQYTNDGLSIARNTKDTRRIAVALNNLGLIHSAMDEMQKAVESLEEALQIFRKLKNLREQANTLNNLGEACRRTGSYEKALAYYHQSLPLAQKEGDRRREGVSLNNIGLVFRTRGEWRKAIEYYEQAIPLFRMVGAKDQEANTLENISQIHMMQGDPQTALKYLDQSLSLWREIGMRYRLAYAFVNIGGAYSLLGDYPNALYHYRQALLLWRTLGKRQQEARSLITIARLYDLLGEKQLAIDRYKDASDLWRELGSRRAAASALSNIVRIYDSLDNKQRAIDYQNQVDKLRHSQASSLSQESAQDELTREELANLQRMLTFARSTGDRVWEARALNRLGNLYFSDGETKQAIDHYRQALDIFLVVGGNNRREVALTLNSMAIAYQSIDEKQQVISSHRQAAELFRNAGDRRQEARSLSRLADAYSSSGEKQLALGLYRKSITLFQEIGEHRDAVIPLDRLGQIYESLGEIQKALEVYLQARALWQDMKARVREAGLLTRIGDLYEKSGEKQQAREYYNLAHRQWQTTGTLSEEASILYKLARVDRDLGNLDGARSAIEEAISLIESVRGKVISQELRTSYLAAKHYYYELHIDLLMEMHQRRPSEGFNKMALQASERARARSLLEILAEAGVGVRQGVNPELLEQERALEQQLSDAGSRKIELMMFDEKNQAELASVNREIDTAIAQLDNVKSQIRNTSPRYASLTQPAPLSIEEIQHGILDADTLLLVYALGERRSYLWAVTQTTIDSYGLPKRIDIETAALRVRELLSTGNCTADGETAERKSARLRWEMKQYTEEAIKLSQILLGPITRQLGKKRLVIVADGVLHYIPFGALPDPKVALNISSDPKTIDTPPKHTPDSRVPRRVRTISNKQILKKNPPIPPSAPAIESQVIWQPLMIGHEIAYLPSASTLAALRRELAGRPPATKMLAVLADPIFEESDERIMIKAPKAENQNQSDQYNLTLTKEREIVPTLTCRANGKRSSRLPHTRQEAEQIIRLDDTTRSMIALDSDASRTTVMSGRLSQYRYVHFGTHAQADNERPELSTIVLSRFDERGTEQQGFLYAYEIYNLILPAELVVLSACETGIGKQVKGEGVISLTRGFMYAGAKRVVVSLWSVSDQATAELMIRFYYKMLKEKKNPASALRAAQIEMWHSEKWRAPYYWAAFTLQGEWQ